MSSFQARGAVAAVCLAGLLLAGCTDFTLNPPPPEEIRADAATVVDDREIIALVPDAGAARALLSGATTEGFVLREQSALPGLGLEMLRLTIPASLDGPGAIAALERIEPSSTAGVNHAYTLAATGAARLDYAQTMMGWPDRACPARGPVGMLDTGIDTGVPELAGVRIVSESFVRGGAAPMHHGTEVASLLADGRRLNGVTLYGAAVVGTSPRGRTEAGVDSLLEALDWMAANGVRLVNVSLAGPYNKLLDRGIDRATAHGMTIVAATGNDGADAAPRYPAALDNVIAVTAVDAAGAVYGRAVRGTHVDVAAPGVDVMLTMDGRTRFATGTSFAAPFVTSRLAADPALYGSGSPRIRRALTSMTRDLGDPGPDPVYGAGLLMAAPDCAP